MAQGSLHGKQEQSVTCNGKTIQIKTKLAKREQALSRKVSVIREMITQHIVQVSRFETEGKTGPVFERNYLQHFPTIKMSS